MVTFGPSISVSSSSSCSYSYAFRSNREHRAVSSLSFLLYANSWRCFSRKMRPAFSSCPSPMIFFGIKTSKRFATITRAMDIGGFYLLHSEAMAGTGKRELKSLGIETDADEPTRKSTRRRTFDGRKLAIFKLRPSKDTPATGEASSLSHPTARLSNQLPPEHDTNSAISLSAPISLHDEIVKEPTPIEPTPASTPAPPEPQLRDCASCAETLDVNIFPSLATCDHDGDVCRDCFSGWVSEQLNALAWDRLTCPSSECTTFLTSDDLQAHVAADVFER
jgi:hypothetical protein